SVWFNEYAYATNQVAISFAVFRSPSGSNVLYTGAIVPSLLKTNPYLLTNFTGISTAALPVSPQARVAIEKLGPNAGPYLVQQLNIGTLNRTYERIFTNFPTIIKRKLPNPEHKRWHRDRALDAIAEVGYPVRDVTPTLLELLKERDPWIQTKVIQ